VTRASLHTPSLAAAAAASTAGVTGEQDQIAITLNLEPHEPRAAPARPEGGGSGGGAGGGASSSASAEAWVPCRATAGVQKALKPP